MFIGHFGVALAAQTVAPRPSLGTLILAAQWIDLVWPFLLLAGIERVNVVPGHLPMTPLEFAHYPWTHSLLAVLCWALLFALAYRIVRGDARSAAWLGALVVSHWVLDLVVHEPDLPLWPGGPKVGLGAWHSVPLSLALEFVLLGAGAWLYVRATHAADRRGTWLLIALLGLLVALYLGALLGPPPPSVQTLAYSALAGWLFVAWGYWIGRHRVAVAAAGA
jgi:membrane-bound metal-dependent hydrolase YbcI (DUF457 family)